MSELLLVNPNTTPSMTEKMVAAARAVAASATQVEGYTAEYGPESIEGYYDEVFAIPPLIARVIEHPRVFDGVIVGCFDDTGVDALRARLRVPVIGLCQAALQFATVLAGKITIVTTLERSVPALEQVVMRHGFDLRSIRIRASEVPVLDLEDPDSPASARIRAEIGRAVEEDRAEAIVLGCAGMSDLAAELGREFERPVVEGVSAAVKIIEGLNALGLETSGAGGYAPPRPKRYSGVFATFAPSKEDGP